MRRAAAVLLILFLIVPSVHAQWNVTVPKLLRMEQNTEEAAIVYKNGIVWAGSFALYSSHDSGATWTKANLPLTSGERVMDIALADTSNILVTSFLGVYGSSDAGQTWRVLLDYNRLSQGASGCFGATTDTIIVIDFTGSIWRSTDAGTTWKDKNLNTVAQKVVYRNGAFYALTGVGNPPPIPFTGGRIMKSIDGGATWVALAGETDQDAYTMGFDSCFGAAFITNEAHSNDYDSVSQVMRSSDDGQTWQVSVMGAPEYFAGALATGRQCLFASTTSGGVYRLTNAQWDQIGGPKMLLDTRCMCAINDQVVIVIDADGNMVRTTNSGGVPIPGNYHDAALSKTSLFDTVVLTPCETSTQAVSIAPYSGLTCYPPRIISHRIEGKDVASFSILRKADASLTELDSEVVMLTPHSVAQDYSATLVIDLNDGTTWRVALRGRSIDSTKLNVDIADVKTDTIGDLLIPIRGRVPRALTALLRYDTSSLVFLGANDLAGIEMNHGDLLRFDTLTIVDRDTLVGTLHFLFYPRDSKCASISIDSLAFESSAAFCGVATGSTATVCYTGACGYGLFSGLMRYGTPRFRIAPNPALNEAHLVSTESLDGITVSLFDATGVLRKIGTSASIDLTDLPEGVFLVRLQSGATHATLRLVHILN